MNSNWLFSARIPFTDATRRENGQLDDVIRGLGDINISASYSPWGGEVSHWNRLSFNAGFILPTGKARDNPRSGASVPSVFQLGTGTTQLTLGGNYFGTMNEDWSYFIRANITLPLYESSKDFLPAETFFLSAGVSRIVTEKLTVKCSIGLFHGEKDTFLERKISNTGSTVLSLTPALVYSINDALSASASVVFPLYRRVNATALAAGELWSFGLSYSF